MADIQTPSNRRFWAVPRMSYEPTRIECNIPVIQGKSMFLRLGVFHQQMPRRAPSMFADLQQEAEYQAGYATELKDLGYVERS